MQRGFAANGKLSQQTLTGALDLDARRFRRDTQHEERIFEEALA
jgi:hypothetical protein